jgi:hypothetical protein
MVPTEPKEFDLSASVLAAEKNNRGFRWMLIGFTVVGLVVIVLALLTRARTGAWSPSIVLLLGTGCVWAVLAAWVSGRFRPRSSLRLRVMETGLQFVDDRGITCSVSWAEPRFSVRLWESFEVVPPGEQPFAITVPGSTLATEIPENAFREVFLSARAAGARIESTRCEGGRNSGWIIHLITRNPT